MDTIHYDVLVIGGGGAGLRAAIAVAEENPRLSVCVASKVYPMRSHTVAAEGGAAAVVREGDSLDAHAYDTISGGDWLCDQDAVEIFVREAPEELLRLEHWGCPWSRTEEGRVATRPFGGMNLERTWYATDKTGFHMLHTLYQTTLKYPSISFRDEWFIVDLLIEEERCYGAIAIELASGRIVALLAGAVVLCTGGGGRVFPFTTNANIKTGDGMAFAYRAGVALKDMEFVQYHPTGLPFTGILITEAARGEGGWLVNRDGYRYLQDYDLGSPEPGPVKRSMELGPRDRLSQAFVGEQEKGRTIPTKWGEVVHLDVRHLGSRRIDERLPFVRELCRKYQKIDPVSELIPVRPVVHYMMGGVHTDVRGATSLSGLFAAGEVACVSINGANRLGSNSLTELLVFGARAGRGAALEAKEAAGAEPESIPRRARDVERWIEGDLLRNADSGERMAPIREAMQRTLESYAGIYREGAGLEVACQNLSDLRRRMAGVVLDDRSLTFNTELIQYLELRNMLDVSEAIIHAALGREESRGSHQRRDWPERDDDRFLAHSLVRRTSDGSPRVDLLPVTVTRWEPGERVYGR